MTATLDILALNCRLYHAQGTLRFLRSGMMDMLLRLCNKCTEKPNHFYCRSGITSFHIIAFEYRKIFLSYFKNLVMRLIQKILLFTSFETLLSSPIESLQPRDGSCPYMDMNPVKGFVTYPTNDANPINSVLAGGYGFTRSSDTIKFAIDARPMRKYQYFTVHVKSLREDEENAAIIAQYDHWLLQGANARPENEWIISVGVGSFQDDQIYCVKVPNGRVTGYWYVTIEV